MKNIPFFKKIFRNSLRERLTVVFALAIIYQQGVLGAIMEQEKLIRKTITITVNPLIHERMKKLVAAGMRENISRVVEECLIGYLHVVEYQCGAEFIQPERANRSKFNVLVRIVKAISDADLLGESLALAYDRKAVEEQIKKLEEFRDERLNDEGDDAEE